MVKFYRAKVVKDSWIEGWGMTESVTEIFPPHDIESMNEDDVAGELVRPLCRALGYTQGGSKANLRSQIPLQYDKAFLGHRDAKKDPLLRGRPDFVCEVVSFTRWVVEAKSPSIELSLADSQQAHTYATHPEIAAEFYMLTNGRMFRLYRVGKPEEPILQWEKEQTADLFMALENILGPEAMIKRAQVKIDVGKPLARGVASSVKIVSGDVVFTKNIASIPLTVDMDGLRNAVTGNFVSRREDGLISAEVELQSAFAGLDQQQRAMGFYPLHFNTSDEYISQDVDKPTILQNILRVGMKRGDAFPKTMFSPGGIIPVDIDVVCFTEAVGFIDAPHFKGTFFVDYEYTLDVPPGMPLPRLIQMRSEGTFNLSFQ
jgi:hypothetical protein